MTEFGARIAVCRQARGWSLRELQQLSGVDKSTVSRIERGACRPSLDCAVKLADAFQVTLDYLAGRRPHYE